MNFFLARVSVTKTPYMGSSTTSDTQHLVRAEDAEDALKKVQAWYEAKSEDYSVSYWADVQILETIE